ncbi:MAG: CDP-diacylglycerol--glycerol-3-phosphate 3-phosphatidyltransferase [Gammaproteobacteria bacterium]|nr:CDP-diacylglycerol--glycerol-3-phosphate 3-phosphatidyltransferase [Gammaproteobacteria bacterium]NNC98080.1 CDP-diacylglycerol--glycerol-3-phosphate 3-phosphatidyltransferase [Gammaproteobacteria bacterium]NNM13144.1 CDP-diacylglycerol--glycerol-3-phosphate 3-phosphatidyltransferase [Gammaproteobacteria bacterium]
MKAKIPNLLTWMRIVLIPVFILIFLSGWSYSRPIAAVIFAIAGISDWLDGYLARRWNQESLFGAFLDPVADKLLVSTALILIVSDAPPGLSLWIILAAIIIVGREIAVSALREWMANSGMSSAVKVKFIGKVKTTFQIGALIAMLYQQPLFGLPTYAIGFASLVLAAVLTMVSMSMYLQTAFAAIKNKPAT